MRTLSSASYDGRMLAWLLPFWTKLPGTSRMGVAAVVLTVAFVSLIVGTRVRQAVRSVRPRSQARTAVPVDTSWFAAHTLDGFPEEAARAALNPANAPSRDRLYAAWVLATHTYGASAEWLEKNLAMPPDAAHLIVEAAEGRRWELAERESREGNGRVPARLGEDRR
ncbi:hypothetical protein [Streptomyces sp. NPDC056160]|uniref:hypothetical protein n=1 Tax=Streptomyces sp. NPDC056160 TaxID=3345731 RepID=UPI0035DC8165